VDRTVVEGASPYKLAPGAYGGDEADESEWDGNEDGTGSGTVYRVAKGQLRKLEGGMEQYGELAARTAARLGSR
jgi:ATP-binding cassette subfamily F protein 3